MSKPRRPWFGQWTLAHRILAVNLLTIVLLAFGVLYLDAFRNQLSDERLDLVRREADIAASVLAASLPFARCGHRAVGEVEVTAGFGFTGPTAHSGSTAGA